MDNKHLPENIDELVQPGVLTRDGFLGDDTRRVSEIIEDDLKTLEEIGLTAQQFATRMTELTSEGKDLMEREVSTERRYSIKVRDDRGPMPDPFGGAPKRKGDTTVKDYKSGKIVRWNELTISMIRDYGFFGGKNDLYRIDPVELAKILGLLE